MIFRLRSVGSTRISSPTKTAVHNTTSTRSSNRRIEFPSKSNTKCIQHETHSSSQLRHYKTRYAEPNYYVYPLNLAKSPRSKSKTLWIHHISSYNYRKRLEKLVFEEKNLQQAVVTYMEMKARGTPLTEHGYIIMINCFARLNRKDKMEELLKEMIQIGLTPSIYTYNQFLYHASVTKDTEMLKSWWKKMLDAKITPNETAISILLKALIQSKNWVEVEECFVLTKEYNIPLTSHIFSTVISACGKAKDLEMAEKWFEAMNEHNVKKDVSSYTAMISAYAHAGRIEAAHKLMDTMEREGIPLNKNIYNHILKGYANTANMDKVTRWLETMKRKDIKVDAQTFQILILAFGKYGKTDEMMVLYNKMIAHHSPTVNLFRNMVYYCQQHGDHERGKQCLQLWKAFDSTIDKVVTTDFSLDPFDDEKEKEAELQRLRPPKEEEEQVNRKKLKTSSSNDEKLVNVKVSKEEQKKR